MKKTVVVSVRMPEDLRDELDRAANEDVRSLSQEIVYLVQRGLEERKRSERKAPPPP